MQSISRYGMSFILGLGAALILTGVVSSQPAGRQVIDPGGPGTDNPNRAYSRGVRIGDTLYIAGNTGQVQNTGSIEADVEAEIRDLLDSFKGNIMRRSAIARTPSRKSFDFCKRSCSAFSRSVATRIRSGKSPRSVSRIDATASGAESAISRASSLAAVRSSSRGTSRSHSPSARASSPRTRLPV